MTLKELQKDNYKLFRQACEDGDLEMIKDLIIQADQYPILLELMFNSKHCEAFFTSHVTIIKYLITITNILHVQIGLYEPLKNACENGYLEIAKLFIEEAKKMALFCNILMQYNYAIFKETCGRGQLDIVKLLVKEAKELHILTDMLKSHNYSCFQLAFHLHKTDVTKYLLEEALFLDVEIHKEMSEACLVL